jgi:hypothetical protein
VALCRLTRPENTNYHITISFPTIQASENKFAENMHTGELYEFLYVVSGALRCTYGLRQSNLQDITIGHTICAVMHVHLFAYIYICTVICVHLFTFYIHCMQCM